ncbi:MAG: Ribonuclease [Verrucomicrobiales bacterium]|nr:Ribonuclease [Verrucomicrobiales bacterium]
MPAWRVPSPTPNTYTRLITADQARKLHALLEERGFTFEKKDYTIFAAKRDQVNVAVYEKGPKILVQGKGLADFVEFILEPEILGVAELGYEEVTKPEMYTPHFGIDESGKGDFFGPLVIAGVYTDSDVARRLVAAGVQDSKAITSDARIRALADTVRATSGVEWDVVSMGPERYNHLYGEAGNLNRLLAWGHSTVIENLLKKRPDCPRALSDQFAHESVLKKALGPGGRAIRLDQRTKGESDVAVAAASILARERFIDWMDVASKKLGISLPRGATSVKPAAHQLIKARGADFLPRVCKMHFKTAREVLGLPPLEKPISKWVRRK